MSESAESAFPRFLPTKKLHELTCHQQTVNLFLSSPAAPAPSPAKARNPSLALSRMPREYCNREQRIYDSYLYHSNVGRLKLKIGPSLLYHR